VTGGVKQRAFGKRSLLLTVSAVLVFCLTSFAQLRIGLDDAHFSTGSAQTFVLHQLRIPRLVIGFFVGSTLAIVGAAFQTLFQNPLATPSTVGTTAGATLGALLALVLGFSSDGMLPAVSLFAFLGALGASFLVMAVASSARARVEEILLAGIAVTLATGALSQGLHAIGDANALFAATQWSLGQLPQVGFERAQLMALPTAVCLVAILSQRSGLAALALGEDWARSVGVETKRVQRVVILGGCFGVGTAVALCGPIAFVGLLVPHLVRRSLGAEKSPFLLLSWLTGGVFLSVCDLLARSLLPEQELPVGVLTASLGAPALFLLILKKDTKTRRSAHT
jgi:ABC-type Fe3+-siderophore transport system permease subunit